MLRIAVLLILLVVAAPLRAGPGVFAAVGLLDRAGKHSACTGVLVAPQLVLTAAHCLAWDDGKGLRFRPSLASGAAGEGIPVARRVVHPAYLAFFGLLPHSALTLARDLALAELERPVPPETALPLPVSAPPEAPGTPLFVAGYRGPAGGPLRQRACPLVGRQGGVLVLGCAVRSGESGSPVVEVRHDASGAETTLQVTGIVSARLSRPGQEVALAVPLGVQLDILMRAAGMVLPAH